MRRSSSAARRPRRTYAELVGDEAGGRGRPFGGDADDRGIDQKRQLRIGAGSRRRRRSPRRGPRRHPRTLPWRRGPRRRRRGPRRLMYLISRRRTDLGIDGRQARRRRSLAAKPARRSSGRPAGLRLQIVAQPGQDLARHAGVRIALALVQRDLVPACRPPRGRRGTATPSPIAADASSSERPNCASKAAAIEPSVSSGSPSSSPAVSIRSINPRTKSDGSSMPTAARASAGASASSSDSSGDETSSTPTATSSASVRPRPG